MVKQLLGLSGEVEGYICSVGPFDYYTTAHHSTHHTTSNHTTIIFVLIIIAGDWCSYCALQGGSLLSLGIGYV